MNTAFSKSARNVSISASAVSAATISVAVNDKARAVFTADCKSNAAHPVARSTITSVPTYNLLNNKGFQAPPSSSPHEVSCLDEFQNKLLPIIMDCPPSVEEVDGAIDSIISRPKAFESLFPIDVFNHPDFGLMLDKVRKVVTEPELILAAKSSIEKKKAEKAIVAEKGVSLHYTVQQISKDWNELFIKFPCTICQDVIAAPVVLDCGHSFCGLCINEYYNSCVSDDAEVMHSCPVCKQDFTDDFRYEINYDQCVQYDVNKFPDCEEKEKWEHRRMAYMDLRKAKEKAAAEAEIKEAEEYDHMVQGAFWVVTFLVIMLIVVARKP